MGAPYYADYPDRSSLEEAILSQMVEGKRLVHLELIGQPAIDLRITEHLEDIILGTTEGDRKVTVDLRHQSVTIE